MRVDLAELFFQDYAQAFTRFDVEHICALWAYPAFLAARGKSVSLNADEFYKNTIALCEFYKAQGVARAAKQLLDLNPLSATLSTARTRDLLTDERGELIAEWTHAYLLSSNDDGKISCIAAFPDEELDVWRARGTPLGS